MRVYDVIFKVYSKYIRVLLDGLRKSINNEQKSHVKTFRLLAVEVFIILNKLLIFELLILGH